MPCSPRAPWPAFPTQAVTCFRYNPPLPAHAASHCSTDPRMQDDRLAQARLLVGNYVEPYLGMPLSDAEAVKSVQLRGRQVSVDVELGFPAGAYAGELAAVLQARLRAAPGLEDAVVNVAWRVASHPVQGQLQPLPGIRNVLAVASGKGGVGKS